MIDAKLNKIGRFFWIVIAALFTLLFFAYSYGEGRLSLPFLMPLVAVAVWEAVRKYTGREVYYYPKNVLEYVVENGAFFAMYIALHLLLKDKYTTLQAIYVVCMIAIVAFDTYALARVVKSVGT